jgi:PiT family inorganic phosphate transporter
MASQDALAKLDSRPQLSHRPGRATLVLFFGLLLAGLAYTFWSLKQDVSASGTVITTVTPFLLLGLALLIALGFEFVNGFHDTANAVATVIYTHSLPAPVAVVWSGLCNFLGVLLSSGAVAFGIIALLPVELILQVGSGRLRHGLRPAAGGDHLEPRHLVAGPAGLVLAHADRLDHRRGRGQRADAWARRHQRCGLGPGQQGRLCPAVLAADRFRLRRPAAAGPARAGQAQGAVPGAEGQTPPPWWIRGVLILTCTGVSFAHGSNDGQKGMGLIMLILVGTLPMAYALNKTMPSEQALQFSAVAEVTRQALVRSAPHPPRPTRPQVSTLISEAQGQPGAGPALAGADRHDRRRGQGLWLAQPRAGRAMANVRNDMYLTRGHLPDQERAGGVRRRHCPPCATVQASWTTPLATSRCG